ncbi:hypothetical protein C0J52_10235 [Blattella germanica]|nr:hypothetical protein C0J52_10235 [Blattella germanica]
MVRVRQIRGPHIFLIRQGGPAAFVLHEEGRSKPVRVRLGDPHLCSCKTFQKEHDLCSHICWILLKKLQLKPDDPLSFQGKYKKAASTVKKHCPPSPDSSPVPNRPISPRDACAICLENLIKSRKTVMCCRYGCGRPVHICCMMVLANYQKLNTPHLQCPMCRRYFVLLISRGDFATREELQKEDRRRRQRRLQLPPIPPPPQALAVHQGKVFETIRILQDAKGSTVKQIARFIERHPDKMGGRVRGNIAAKVKCALKQAQLDGLVKQLNPGRFRIKVMRISRDCPSCGGRIRTKQPPIKKDTKKRRAGNRKKTAQKNNRGSGK